MTLRQIQIKNDIKLKKLGLICPFMDGANENKLDSEKIKKIPFSTYYNTYEEYEKDLNLVLNMGKQDKIIPEDIYNKLYNTQKELGIAEV